MSLNWNFKTDKIGEWLQVDFVKGKKYETNMRLYSGNALLIGCIENDEDNTYSVNTFFCDKEHMKNCLGLTKGYDNIYNHIQYNKITLFKEYRYTKDIVNAFIKAKFDNTIEIQIIQKGDR